MRSEIPTTKVVTRRHVWVGLRGRSLPIIFVEYGGRGFRSTDDPIDFSRFPLIVALPSARPLCVDRKSNGGGGGQSAQSTRCRPLDGANSKLLETGGTSSAHSRCFDGLLFLRLLLNVENCFRPRRGPIRPAAFYPLSPPFSLFHCSLPTITEISSFARLSARPRTLLSASAGGKR